MSTTTIRGGRDAVAVQVDEHGVRISLGPDGISASVTLDFGEARLLAETILSELETLLEVVLEVAAQRDDVSLPSMVAGIPDIWAIVQQGDQVEFEKESRRERDLVLMSNPELWPIRDRLFVKRIEDGHYEGGFLRPERGPSIWDGADLVEAFEDFEQMIDAGWVVD